MQEASIDGKKYTNHSLHATGTTTLFDAGVPEAIIQKRSGHCSTKALRTYERVTQDRDLAVSRILHSTSKVLHEPVSKSITLIPESIDSNDFDPDTSISCKDLKIFNFVDC